MQQSVALVPLTLTTDLVRDDGRVFHRGTIIYGKAATRPKARLNDDYTITTVDEAVWIVRVDGELTVLREWCAAQLF
jgi:hypothetical protein